MPGYLAAAALALGLTAWGILALWAPGVEIASLLATLRPGVKISVTGALLFILVSGFLSRQLGARQASRLAAVILIPPFVVLAVVLLQAVGTARFFASQPPGLPTDIIAVNVADPILGLSLGLGCATAALVVHRRRSDLDPPMSGLDRQPPCGER